ncbi:MAG: DNA mismatch repair protein MutS [Gemmatimonadetes bacterium]|nr:DNA mismatch repair protein MutS [Gemmatimonadota bacterium]
MTDPRAIYAQREAEASKSADSWRARFDRLAHLRMGVTLALAAAIVAYLIAPGAQMLLIAVSVVLIVIFIVLVVRHSSVRRREIWYREMAQVALEARHRRLRRWEEFSDTTAEPPPHHPYADDLDVFGHASLHVLLGTTCTRPGADMLTDWLLAPASTEIVRRRQSAVRELAPAIDFRDELQAMGRIAGPVEPKQLQLLLEWAESPAWLLPKWGPRWLAVVLPTLMLVTGGLHIFAVVPYLWIIPLVAAVGVTKRYNRRIHDDFTRTSSGDSGLRRYHSLVAHIADGRFEDPLLAELRESLIRGGATSAESETSVESAAPAEALKRLFRLVELSNIRYNPQVHYVWNLATLWDIHVLVRLERWKNQHGAALRGWMTALGRTDALSALAGLAHAHPDWAFPEISDAQPDGAPRLEAKALGHPLLAPEIGVRNDVSLGPPGSLLLVTGSNMSGKSTLLRAIGANVVLAGAGGPVCAEMMALPVADLRTSMRIRDSLEEGISYFMAELGRLKAVCDAASAANERPVLYLLDEILQGTNTAERQIAARRILRHLLDQRAIGAVTTHDLTLADAEDLKERAVLVHFRESVEAKEGGPPISFDYQLRPGLATSTNALRLMEIMGLALPENGG